MLLVPEPEVSAGEGQGAAPSNFTDRSSPVLVSSNQPGLDSFLVLGILAPYYLVILVLAGCISSLLHSISIQSTQV